MCGRAPSCAATPSASSRSQTSFQDNSVAHTDPGFPMVIGADCVIGHQVIVHGAAIGARCLIGMGTMLLNGARSARSASSAPARW